MTDEERLARGIKTFDEVHAGVVKLPDKIDPNSFNAHVMRDVYNDVWGRKAMSQRERRMLVIGALAAQTLPAPLEIHMKSAIELGELGAEEIKEIFYVLSVYIGMPRTTTVMEIANRLLPGAL
jgi:4-carboxymuconolactone decarboxylase